MRLASFLFLVEHCEAEMASAENFIVMQRQLTTFPARTLISQVLLWRAKYFLLLGDQTVHIAYVLWYGLVLVANASAMIHSWKLFNFPTQCMVIVVSWAARCGYLKDFFASPPPLPSLLFFWLVRRSLCATRLCLLRAALDIGENTLVMHAEW